MEDRAAVRSVVRMGMDKQGNKKTIARRLWTPADGVLIALVAAAAVIILVFSLKSGKNALKQPKLEVIVGNEVTALYPLTEDRTIEVGEGNRCEIRDGEVRMMDADCPDQICVHTRAIDARGGSIVCLPHQVILRVVDGDAQGQEVDSVAE